MKPNATFDEQYFAELLHPLPVFAQVLVAFRLVLRAAMANLEMNDFRIALQACNAGEEITRSGIVSCIARSKLIAFVDINRTSKNTSILDAFQFAADAMNAAISSSKLSECARVASIVAKCIISVCNHSQFSKIQVMLVVRSDIDQIRFACEEANVAKHLGLTPHVLSRLAPCHPFTIVEPAKSIEDEYR